MTAGGVIPEHGDRTGRPRPIAVMDSQGGTVTFAIHGDAVVIEHDGDAIRLSPSDTAVFVKFFYQAIRAGMPP